MSTGQWMFYGGLSGAGITVFIVTVWNIILSVKKRKLDK